MQSAFGVEHGDEVSKALGDIPRAFMAGAKGGRSLARGHQVATLGGQAARSVGSAPRSAAAGKKVGGMLGKVGGNSKPKIGHYNVDAIRARRAAARTKVTPPSSTPQPGKALAVIPKPAVAADKTTWGKYGKYSLIGGGGAAAGAVGGSMYTRRNQ